MFRRSTARLLLIATLAASACRGEWDPTADVVREADRRWVRVYADADYDIAVDTAHISRHFTWMGAFGIWYRTQHLRPRTRNGQIWDREITLSSVRCEGLLYRIARVDMGQAGNEPISRQRTTSRELRDQPWRAVEAGTMEEIVARNACHLAGATSIYSVAELQASKEGAQHQANSR